MLSLQLALHQEDELKGVTLLVLANKQVRLADMCHCAFRVRLRGRFVVEGLAYDAESSESRILFLRRLTSWFLILQARDLKV